MLLGQLIHQQQNHFADLLAILLLPLGFFVATLSSFFFLFPASLCPVLFFFSEPLSLFFRGPTIGLTIALFPVEPISQHGQYDWQRQVFDQLRQTAEEPDPGSLTVSTVQFDGPGGEHGISR